ncbi:MAG: radical SAM protein [Nanoarchaeota archaeon]|nr:B12-binding domain-containing radical SAM protein [Nanoarchaeota archaeon]MBU4300825.1 B12-binding domain-containing radical SAM protein [Nanoarchaeota archaeon]MBU4451500.1 B12-binding domain-containing radical SAM protein [Nanoarchaeota archaeon]MCG2723849.1 B12-binding domain-containing radical SAM protein [archaeon]
MRELVFVNSPFIRKNHLDSEEQEFFDVYFEKTKKMLNEEQQSQYEKYLSKSVNLSSGMSVPIYDLPAPPLWISSLSPVAKDAGYSPNVLDLTYLSFVEHALDNVGEKIHDTKGDIFLFSSFTNNYHIVEKIAQHIKKSNPDAINIIGGHHASFMADNILGKTFDIVVRGEGEKTVEELLRALEWDRSRLNTIDGISYFAQNTIHHNADRKLIENLDSLPMPDYDILPNTYKDIFSGRIFASRGCPMKCSFCAESLWSKNYPRYRSVDRVMEEIELMKEKLNIRDLWINDETFTSKKEYVTAICDSIPETGLSWSCQTRADFVNEKTLSKMKNSGCDAVFFGAESADQNILDINNKKLDVRKITDACSLAKSVNMPVATNWLVGLPGESRESAIKTIEYAEKLILKGLTNLVDYYICAPYPSTDIYRRPEHYKVKINSSDFSKYREDTVSVMDTEYLDAASIHKLWKYGLSTFASAMKSVENVPNSPNVP